MTKLNRGEQQSVNNALKINPNADLSNLQDQAKDYGEVVCSYEGSGYCSSIVLKKFKDGTHFIYDDCVDWAKDLNCLDVLNNEMQVVGDPMTEFNEEIESCRG